jgi:signal transduction histidine kinase
VDASTRPVSSFAVWIRRPIDLAARGPGPAFGVYLPAHLLVVTIGFLLIHQPSKLATLWPSAGLLLATLTMVPRRSWWGILPAALLAESLGSLFFDYPLLAQEGNREWALYAPLINVVEATLGAWLYLRGLEPRQPPELARVLYAFIAVTVAVSVGAALGAGGLYLRSGNPYWDTFWAWWAGDLLGILAVAPMLLMWWWAGSGYVGPSDGRRWELLGIIASAAIVCVLVFARGRDDFDLPYALFPVLLWAGARFAPRIVASIGCGVALLAAWLHNQGLGPFSAGAAVIPESMLPLQVFLGMLLATALLVSVGQHDRRALQARLRDYAQMLTQAEDDARRLAAQDLQDGIGQMLVGIRLKIENLKRSVVDANAARELDETTKLLAETQQNTRGLLAELSPPGLYELGLAAAIDALAIRMRERYGLQVRTDFVGDIEAVHIHRRLAAYRIARELLLNVAKHAGTNQAQVQLKRLDDDLQLVVSDSGRGFDDAPGRLPYWSESFGLFGIRDRVTNEGGQFDIDTAPGKGCRVSVTLPATPRPLRES